MAIDTAEKRFSILNFGKYPSLPLIISDGTIGPSDRSHLLNLYSGIALDLPAIVISASIAVLSRIKERGQSVTCAMTSSGQSVLSGIAQITGILSWIDSRGETMTSSIDETGQSVRSDI